MENSSENFVTKPLTRSQIYYRNNREKVLDKQKAKFLQNPEEHNKKSNDYYHKNKDKIKARNRKRYFEKDRERSLTYAKKHRSENSDKYKERSKNYRERNVDKLRVDAKQYREKNKNQIKERYANRMKDPVKKQERKNKLSEYYQENKEKILKISIEYAQNRSKTDPLYAFTKRIRSMISVAFRRRGYTKRSKTQSILGCSFEYLKTHLESKFEPWMNWDNKGLYNGTEFYGWDVDHIIPLSTARTLEELIKLNHYTNLRPLCSKINRDIKRDKFDFQ
jgi:hypothetical protein